MGERVETIQLPADTPQGFIIVNKSDADCPSLAKWLRGGNSATASESPIAVGEVTSAAVASKAARILKDPDASADAKSVAASALTQAPDKPKRAKRSGKQ